MTPRELNERLKGQVKSVCSHLLPNGNIIGGEWCVGSVGGEQGESLKVKLNGSKTGVWSDFASGQSGDLVELWRVTRGLSFPDTLNQIKDFLGIHDDKLRKNRVKKKTEQPEIKTNGSEIPDWLVQWILEERKITPEAFQKYHLTADGEILIFPFHGPDGNLVMVKYRDMGQEKKRGKKKIWANKEPQYCLFGWSAVPDNAREIVICEGEFDAMSFASQGIPALSVPFGGGDGDKQLKWLEFEYDNLERFDKIYLALDQDEQGEKATKEIMQRLGSERCFIVELPEKDANECHKKGLLLSEFIKTAKTIDPDELVSATSMASEVEEQFEILKYGPTGVRLPWDSTYDNIRFRKSEVSVFTGINGHGKSLLLGQLVVAGIQQGEKYCIASMEMPPVKTLYRMVRQVADTGTPTNPYIRAIMDWFDDQLWVFNVVGNAKAERMLDVFKYGIKRYGIKHFVVDSLTKCGFGEDDYNAQKEFMDRLSDFAHQYEVHVYLVAHPRKGASEDDMPGKLDIRGAAAITNLADNVFTVWRNKKKETEIAKLKYQGAEVPDDLRYSPDMIFKCVKQRDHGWEGTVPLYFNPESLWYRDTIKEEREEIVKFRKEGSL